MDGKLRNRPTMFMNSVRPKSAVFKFKVWPQKRSQNLSCNPAQTLLRILPISGVLEGQMTWNLVGGRKRQFTTTFMKKIFSNSNGNNDISSRVWGLSTSTNSTTQYFSHISSSSDPNALTFYGWQDKMISNNFHEEHFAKFWMEQCHFIQPKCLSVAVHQVH